MATGRIPWARVLVEGVVIVASILLAFGIDAWWEGRQERELVRQDLEAVVQELADNRERIIFQIDMMERVVAAQAFFLDAAGSAGDATDVPLPDTLVWLLSAVPTLNASLGAVDALIASGRLASIESPGVRARLSGIRGAMDDATEGQTQARSLYFDQLVPLTRDRLSRGGIAHITDEFVSAARVPGRRLVSRGMVSYPSTPAISAITSERSLHYRVSLGEMRQLVEEFEQLQRLK